MAVTAPWNWKASLLLSTWFWRSRTLPSTASTSSVYAEAAPPCDVDDVGLEDRAHGAVGEREGPQADLLLLGEAGDGERVQPRRSSATLGERAGVDASRPTSAAAFAPGCGGGERGAAGGGRWSGSSEEET